MTGRTWSQFPRYFNTARTFVLASLKYNNSSDFYEYLVPGGEERCLASGGKPHLQGLKEGAWRHQKPLANLKNYRVQ